jgi:hypothetical protein
MSFFPPPFESSARPPRRPTLRSPEEMEAFQVTMNRFERARRVQAAARIYVKMLLVVAIGCIGVMVYTGVLGARGQVGWRLYSVFILATLCALRSLWAARRLSQSTGIGHGFLMVNILPTCRGTRIRFFIYEIALLLALLIGAAIIGR